MAKAKYVTFHNWTEIPFKGVWDGETIIELAPGEEATLEAGIAETFANRLTQKYLIGAGRSKEVHMRQKAFISLKNKFFVGKEVEATREIMDAKLSTQKPKSKKKGQSKKEEVSEPINEESFEQV